MKDAQGRPVTGRVRWRKFAVLAVPGLAATAALAIALADGALAASFAVSGQQFKVSAKSLDGDGFAQYGGVDGQVGKDKPGDLLPVAITAIKKAELRNLCQSVVIGIPFIGDVSLNLKAGGGKDPVKAKDLFVDATQLRGNAEFKQLEIGRDASTLDKGPNNAQGMQGLFAQQADHVTINDLQQVAWATNAATFTLSGLSMDIAKGKRECF